MRETEMVWICGEFSFLWQKVFEVSLTLKLKAEVVWIEQTVEARKVCKEECWCSKSDCKSNTYPVREHWPLLASYPALLSLCFVRQCVACSMYSCERVINTVKMLQWCCKCLAPLISKFLHFSLLELNNWSASPGHIISLFDICLCQCNQR